MLIRTGSLFYIQKPQVFEYKKVGNCSGIMGNIPNFDHLPGLRPANDQNSEVYAQYLSSY